MDCGVSINQILPWRLSHAFRIMASLKFSKRKEVLDMKSVLFKILGFTCLCFPLLSDVEPVGASNTVSACLGPSVTPACQLNLVSDTSVSVNQTVSADGGSANFQAFAEAQPGTFRASVQDTILKVPTTPYFGNIVLPFTASASMTDQITVSAPGFNGSLGYWGLNVAVSGTFGIIVGGQLYPGQGSAVTGIEVSFDGETPPLTYDLFPNDLPEPASATVNFGFFPIAYGTPFSFDVILTTQDDLVNAVGATEFDNFSETATITGLSFFDAQMNPVTDVSLTSGSGAIYTLNGVVPEPPSLPFIVGASLLVLVGSRITRREVRK
jgi:hypothetical protein